MSLEAQPQGERHYEPEGESSQTKCKNVEADPSQEEESSPGAPGDKENGVHQEPNEAGQADTAGTSSEGEGLTLGDLVEEETWISGQVSTSVRYLAVGGFTVAWLLAGGSLAGLRDNRFLVVPMVGFFLVFAADLQQYTEGVYRARRIIEDHARMGCGLKSQLQTVGDLPETTDRWFGFKRHLLMVSWVILGWEGLWRVFC